MTQSALHLRRSVFVKTFVRDEAFLVVLITDPVIQEPTHERQPDRLLNPFEEGHVSPLLFEALRSVFEDVPVRDNDVSRISGQDYDPAVCILPVFLVRIVPTDRMIRGVIVMMADAISSEAITPQMKDYCEEPGTPRSWI
jgi:hypothetical protein